MTTWTPFKPAAPKRRPARQPIWAMTRKGHRLTASILHHENPTGFEVQIELDGELYFSERFATRWDAESHVTAKTTEATLAGSTLTE